MHLNYFHQSHYSLHLKTPSTMLDTLLNGSYQKLQQHLIEENSKTILKRKLPPNEVTFPEKARFTGVTRAKSCTIPCKSKGRWNNCQIKSFCEFKAHSKYSLNDKWKIDLKKCIDSSPLLFVKGVSPYLFRIWIAFKVVFQGSKRLSLAAPTPALWWRWTSGGTGTPSSCSEHSVIKKVMIVFCVQNRSEHLDTGITRSSGSNSCV